MKFKEYMRDRSLYCDKRKNVSMEAKNEMDFRKLSKYMNEASDEQLFLYRKYINEQKPEEFKKLVESIND